jgi:hypothetical protein
MQLQTRSNLKFIPTALHFLDDKHVDWYCWYEWSKFLREVQNKNWYRPLKFHQWRVLRIPCWHMLPKNFSRLKKNRQDSVGVWGKNFGYGVRSSLGRQEQSYGKTPLGIQEKVSAFQVPYKLTVYHMLYGLTYATSEMGLQLLCKGAICTGFQNWNNCCFSPGSWGHVL